MAKRNQPTPTAEPAGESTTPADVVSDMGTIKDEPTPTAEPAGESTTPADDEGQITSPVSDKVDMGVLPPLPKFKKFQKKDN